MTHLYVKFQGYNLVDIQQLASYPALQKLEIPYNQLTGMFITQSRALVLHVLLGINTPRERFGKNGLPKPSHSFKSMGHQFKGLLCVS